MSHLNETKWVKQQYRTSTNLNARVQLHQRFSTNPEPWFGWVFDRLNLAPGERILEVGGGHGLLWRENLDRLPGVRAVVLTDLSPGMVAQSANALRGRGPFHLAQADAQQLPFAPRVFDLVIANHMLYHVPDRVRALQEIKRTLRPGGRCIAATNDASHMQELIDLAQTAQQQWPAMAQLLPSHRPFPFDTALEEVSRQFGQVQLHRYANDLVVTDAAALADYMLSSLTEPLSAEADVAFRDWVRQQMGAQGRFVIHSATGLIEAADTL